MFFSVKLDLKNARINEASGQVPPVPPPVQQPPTQVMKNNSNDSDVIGRRGAASPPPVIEFLTNSLIEGKNVVKVKIIEKSGLRYAGLKYVRNGQLITTGLIRDPGDIYKALVDAHLPSTTIVVNAANMNGSEASVAKQLSVTSLPEIIFEQISNFFYDSGKALVSTFTTPGSK